MFAVTQGRSQLCHLVTNSFVYFIGVLARNSRQAHILSKIVFMLWGCHIMSWHAAYWKCPHSHQYTLWVPCCNMQDTAGWSSRPHLHHLINAGLVCPAECPCLYTPPEAGVHTSTLSPTHFTCVLPQYVPYSAHLLMFGAHTLTLLPKFFCVKWCNKLSLHAI